MILNFILPLIITSGIHCFKIYLIAHQRKRTELVGDSLSFMEDNKTYLENMKDGKSIVMFIAVFFFFAGFPIRPVLFSSVCVTHAGHGFQKIELFTFYLFVAILNQLLTHSFCNLEQKL